MRIQLGQGSAVSVTTNMLKNEGVAAFYKVFLHFFSCCFIFSNDRSLLVFAGIGFGFGLLIFVEDLW